jgi:hypothetical protein
MSESAPVATADVVTINGENYPLAMLGLAEVGNLRIWAKSQLPNPLEGVRDQLEGFDERIQRAMIDSALAEARRPVMFGSPEFQSAVQTGDGLREVLWLSLKRAGADVAREASDAAADAMDLDRAADVYATAFGSSV